MSLIKYFKINDKEDCPCGNKKPYALCCKERKDKYIKPSKKNLLTFKLWSNF